MPGLAGRRGGCLGVLGCLSRAGKGDGRLGLGLAAGSVRGGQRCSDPAGVGAASSAAAPATRLAASASSWCRAASGPGGRAGASAGLLLYGGAVIVVPLA